MTQPLAQGPSVVLALGGGGIRGAAHLGVLDTLTGAGVRLAGIAGTSSGALLGALWLMCGTAEATERIRAQAGAGVMPAVLDLAEGVPPPPGLRGVARRAVRGFALVRMLSTRGLLSVGSFLERTGRFVPDGLIEDLPVPFVAVATDHATGEEVWLSRGSLVCAVAASSAMPGLVPPIPWEGRRLQDGGAVAEIPVTAARSLGSPVIAVEVSERMPRGDAEGDRAPTAMFRAAAMGWQELRRRLLAEADAVIAPAVNHLHWADLEAAEQAVEAGAEATRAFLASPAGRALTGRG